MKIALKTKYLLEFKDGCRWESSVQQLQTERVCVLISDMWDRHWSAGATRRVQALAPEINRFVERCREAGATIIHAPSDTMPFYQTHPARLRALEVEPVIDFDSSHIEPRPPLPIDDLCGGSDSGEPESMVNRTVWTRQNQDIRIDAERDYIVGDEGSRVAAILQREGAQLLVYVGVHLNMCVLHTRSFSILQMKRYGVRTAFSRPLTDSMYCPKRQPYVDHQQGTALVADYIEKFVCPSMEVTQW